MYNLTDSVVNKVATIINNGNFGHINARESDKKNYDSYVNKLNLPLSKTISRRVIKKIFSFDKNELSLNENICFASSENESNKIIAQKIANDFAIIYLHELYKNHVKSVFTFELGTNKRRPSAKQYLLACDVQGMDKTEVLDWIHQCNKLLFKNNKQLNVKWANEILYKIETRVIWEHENTVTKEGDIFKQFVTITNFLGMQVR